VSGARLVCDPQIGAKKRGNADQALQQLRKIIEFGDLF
jgi:hypothetical protein